MTALLEITDVSKSSPGVKALDRVSIEVQRGEIHALPKEDGAGKSTLGRIIAGVYRGRTDVPRRAG